MDGNSWSITRKTAAETCAAASTSSFEIVAPAIDHDGVVLLHQERRELAQLMVAEVAVLLQRVGRTHQEEAQRVARHEAFEQRLVHALQILADFHQGVLRRRAELHRDVVADPIQIDGDGGDFALRQHAREVDRHAWWFRRRPRCR